MEDIKCVLVGDPCVGKTPLIVAYTTGSFPGEYVPTVFDNYDCNLMLFGMPIHLRIFDTAGSEDYDRLRPLSYPDADFICICFAVIYPDSYENIRPKWIPEVRHFCPKVPYVIIGTQTDLRGDPATLDRLHNQGKEPISYSKGEALAKEVGAVKYVECSAKTKVGVNEVFVAGISSVPRIKERKDKEQKYLESVYNKIVHNATKPLGKRK